MISALRRVLREKAAIFRERGGYALQVPDHLIDRYVLEGVLAEARAAPTRETEAALLRAAMRLWRGRPLGGVRAPFAVAVRAGLEEQHGATLESMFDAELSLGRHASLVPELTEQVAAHPFRERLLGQLMIALSGSGRQTDALRVFRDARSALAEEHGLEPGPALRTLERQILRGEIRPSGSTFFAVA